MQVRKSPCFIALAALGLYATASVRAQAEYQFVQSIDVAAFSVAVDSSDNIWVSSLFEPYIKEYNSSGALVTQFGAGARRRTAWLRPDWYGNRSCRQCLGRK